MATLATAALIASGVGTVMSTAGAISSANTAKANAANTRKIAEYNAGLSEQAAGQAEAVSQRRAAEAMRQAGLKQSRALALAGASGGGAMDQDVMNIISGFEEEGDYNARMELWQGSETARQYRAEGAAGLYQAETTANNYDSAATGSYINAGSTLMGGASSLYAKYGSS